MAPGEPEPAQLLPGRRRGPGRTLKRTLKRTLSFLFLGGLTFLTLCLFVFHLPAIQRVTTALGPARGDDPSAMTSSEPAAPHRESHVRGLEDPSELQGLLKDHPMAYATNKHPAFKDDPPKLIGDLPEEHIPTYTPPSPTDEPGGGENKTNGKRLVILGDVHGHTAALKALLYKIGFDNKDGDHLIFAGDMVTKGPDSKGVVKMAMDLGASAVRGNQEDKVLAAAREIHRLSVDDQSRLGPDADGEEEEDTAKENDAETERKKGHPRRVARSLTRAQLAWLRSLPIILRIGRLPDATSLPWNATTLAVVHGGLVPGVRLERQDPWAVMNMRSLLYPRKGKGKHHTRSTSEADGDEEEDDDEVAETTSQLDDLTLSPDAVAVPIDGRDGEPWSHAWNRHQNLLPPSAPHTLAIYGHDAKAGLQVNPEVDISPYDPSLSSHSSPAEDNDDNEDDTNNHSDEKENKKRKKKHKKHKKQKGLRYAFGLDSGCGHERQLTALIIEAGPAGVRHRIEQVDCSYTATTNPNGDGGQGQDTQRVVG